MVADLAQPVLAGQFGQQVVILEVAINPQDRKTLPCTDSLEDVDVGLAFVAVPEAEVTQVQKHIRPARCCGHVPPARKVPVAVPLASKADPAWLLGQQRVLAHRVTRSGL